MSTVQSILDTNIALPRERIAALCREYGVEELAVFGSVLRDNFTPESDVDFLVVFKNDDYGPWMGKLNDFEEALGALIGRKADVVPKRSVESSENYIRRKHILGSAQTLYAA